MVSAVQAGTVLVAGWGGTKQTELSGNKIKGLFDWGGNKETQDTQELGSDVAPFHSPGAAHPGLLLLHPLPSPTPLTSFPICHPFIYLPGKC